MRPLLHLTAPSGWVNDPHGLTFHDGRYHLFHQYVPDSSTWAPHCHWGHAVGSDLVSWQHRRVALAPGDGDDGIWTGSLVRDHADGARILYTSVVQPDIAMGRVRVAEPTDATWETWTKGEVVVEPPGELDLIAFRDPFVRREGDGWRMFVGAAHRSGLAMALTYTSDDLERWTYDGVAASRHTSQREPVWMGALWECPQVFEVDGHWVMVSSVWDDDVLHHAGYGIGRYAAGRFEADAWGQLSVGDSYYAPSFFRDREDRPCLMFWMRGVADAGQGWSSCLSLPHLLTVREGRLVAEPHPDVAAHRVRGPVDVATAGPVLDIEWQPDAPVDALGLWSGDTESAVVVVGDGVVRLDRPGRRSWQVAWPGGPVRVVIDGPVLEVSSAGGLLGGPIDVVDRVVPPAGLCRTWTLA